MASRLDIPYVNIDAGSMSDYHTAASQLLGSGRGIVGSHQSGRLEKAAKHHAGAVVEVSDLDHAAPSVRSALADLFLQVLETGEAQSSTGAMFSCANLIFAFTMNLPGGMDEAVLRGIGFQSRSSEKEVAGRVTDEIKKMLSSAFLSRVGTPILFKTLDGVSLAVILERSIINAIRSASERMHCPIKEIIITPGTGAKVLKSLETNIASFGARGILEHGRSLAAEAFSKALEKGKPLSGETLTVSSEHDFQLKIDIK